MAGSPKNHPIGKENHLSQNSTTLGSFAVHFPGCIVKAVGKEMDRNLNIPVS